MSHFRNIVNLVNVVIS